eukprot:2315774-Heterocapsa_arctica.AAC.1
MVATPPAQMKAICDSIDTVFKVRWGGFLDDKHWERYLGREWRHAPHGYRVRIPIGYYDALLESFQMSKARVVSTPFPIAAETKVTDEDDDELPPAEAKLYHSAVGKLMWVLQERPDLSFAVKELSRA